VHHISQGLHIPLKIAMMKALEVGMERTRLAIFDFDDTMCKGDSIVPYLVFCYQKGLFSLGHLVLSSLSGVAFAMKLMKSEAVKSRSLSFVKNVDKQKLAEVGERFVKERLLPNIFPESLKSLMAHRANDDHVLILSASPDVYLQYLKKYLPVYEVICSTVDDNGKIIHNAKGPNKVTLIQEYVKTRGLDVDWENSFAYGDSLSDAGVMALCGNPIKVNPKPSFKQTHTDWKTVYWQ
jgi:HAD superfamily hydrolase (TIGR01490 family)